MNSKIFFFCVFFFGSAYLVKINGLKELSEATAESHPFHAAVKSTRFCSGILITINYVITAAHCVNTSKEATVYLGFNSNQYYGPMHSEKNTQKTQTILSSVVIIHEDFAEIKAGQYLNDIALIKLSQPATVSKTVQPGTLLSRQESYLVEGKHAEFSGWEHRTRTHKIIGTLQIRNRDTCRYLYGDDYLRSQQFCVKCIAKSWRHLVGNTVRIGENIIGFKAGKLPCTVETLGCSPDDVVLNFIPFLDWMSHEMNVPIKEFTSKSHESCENQDLTKLESSVKKINETFYNTTIKNILNEQHFNKLEKTVVDIVKAVEDNKLKAQNWLGEIKTVFNELKHRIGEHIVQESALHQSLNKKFENILTQEALDEQLGYINTTIKNILNEQHFNKLEKTVVDIVKAVEDNKLKAQNWLGEIKTVFNQLKHRIGEHIVQESALHQSLNKKFENILTQEALNEQLGYINTTIKNILNEQHFNKLEKIVVDTVKAVGDNKMEAQNRLSEIEKIFNEQKHRMDEHIVHESALHQSLNKKFENILTQEALNERLGYINTTNKNILNEQHFNKLEKTEVDTVQAVGD